MAGGLALRTFLLFGGFLSSTLSCHLGYTINSIQTPRTDKYEISCSQRALPICPKVCSWTNQTCEEYANRRHWNKTELIVTNMTYSYPLKASGHARNDTGGAKTKSLHRRCCLSINIEATKCTNVLWNIDKTKGKFDVLAIAQSTLKCPTKNAYIKDIQQRIGIQRTYNMEICCLKYPKDHNARVACRAPQNGETKYDVELAAKVALGVSLPLALGIGIPLLVCEVHAQVVRGTIPSSCNNANPPEGLSEKECCSLCKKPSPACVYFPQASAMLVFGAPKSLCFLCNTISGSLTAPFPVVAFYPKF